MLLLMTMSDVDQVCVASTLSDRCMPRLTSERPNIPWPAYLLLINARSFFSCKSSPSNRRPVSLTSPSTKEYLTIVGTLLTFQTFRYLFSGFLHLCASVSMGLS